MRRAGRAPAWLYRMSPQIADMASSSSVRPCPRFLHRAWSLRRLRAAHP